jgi:hypothetical protein
VRRVARIASGAILGNFRREFLRGRTHLVLRHQHVGKAHREAPPRRSTRRLV